MHLYYRVALSSVGASDFSLLLPLLWSEFMQWRVVGCCCMAGGASPVTAVATWTCGGFILKDSLLKKTLLLSPPPLLRILSRQLQHHLQLVSLLDQFLIACFNTSQKARNSAICLELSRQRLLHPSNWFLYSFCTCGNHCDWKTSLRVLFDDLMAEWLSRVMLILHQGGYRTLSYDYQRPYSPE